MSETRARSYGLSPLYSLRQTAALREPHERLDVVGYATTLAVAVAVFLIAFDGGSYDEASRTTLAIGIWWAIVLVVALNLRPLPRVPAAAVVTGGLLLALALFTLASIAWADSAERAFLEFDRTALYLGVFLLAVLAGTRGNAGRWVDGIALGVAAIGILALVSRLFPDLVSAQELRTFLPSAFARLSYPLGYWNGLAILTAISFPLLLRAAVFARTGLLRGVALAPLPALVAVIYLTSSRGGVLTALFGTFCFLVLTARRWSALAAVALAGLGAVAAIAVLQTRHELVNDPSLAVAESQGRSAALLIAGICVLSGVAWAAGTVLLEGRLPASAALDRAAAALVVVAAAVGIAAAHPVERFEHFKRPPQQGDFSATDLVRSHLLSKSGSGRWQLWQAAVDEFETEPVRGRGAGSFESWWAEHGTIEGFARDAHSLYLEMLGELGVVGLTLLGAALLTAVLSALRRTVAASDEVSRGIAAAVTAAFLAFALALAIDWMWELTAVSVVGIALAGLVAGPATALAPARARQPSGVSRRTRLSLAVAVVVVGLFVVGAQAIPLVATSKIQDSQAASARGDAVAAIDDALAAKSIEPWAASPYLQLALLEEQVGRLRAAKRRIAQAIDRDRNDWRLWLVQARIEFKLGHVRAARESLDRTRALNPRSPLFARPG